MCMATAIDRSLVQTKFHAQFRVSERTQVFFPFMYEPSPRLFPLAKWRGSWESWTAAYAP